MLELALALYDRSHRHSGDLFCSEFLLNYMALSAIRTQNQNFGFLLYSTCQQFHNHFHLKEKR